jgi:hypothetical protein
MGFADRWFVAGIFFGLITSGLQYATAGGQISARHAIGRRRYDVQATRRGRNGAGIAGALEDRSRGRTPSVR